MFFILPLMFVCSVATGAVDLTQVDYDYGLTFRSHSFNQDARTGLDLTPDGNFNFKSGFTLDFDLRFGEGQGFGYVFRIVSDDNSVLDMTVNVNNGTMNLILTEEHNTVANIDIGSLVPLRMDEWTHVSVAADRNGITYSLDSVKFDMGRTFRYLDNIKIYFGHNRHPEYYTTDVPPMTIRDIYIGRGGGGGKLAHWTLSEHVENAVFDNIRSLKAHVENGVWEIDKHTRWRKFATLKFRDRNPQIAYDEVDARIFVATNDSVCVYSLDNGTLEHLPVYRDGMPFRSGGSHMIYDTERDKLISYSILFDEFIEYDFDSNRWSNLLVEGLPPIQQHSRYVDRKGRRLIVFGGYGNHIYNGELAVHSLDGGEWEIDNLGHVIAPRYMNAMGYRGDGNLLVMGGYGNDSGKQEESARNLYDLYDIDIDSLSCRRLAVFSSDGAPLAMSASLVVDTLRERLYTLAFDNGRFYSGLVLTSLNLSDNNLTCYGDTIPYRFLDTESWSDLVFRPAKSSLYAIVLQAFEAGSNDVEIWSLAFPPLETSPVGIRRDRIGNAGALLLIIALTVVAGAVYLIMRGKKRDITSSTHTPGTERHVSSIFMLDGLQIFDAEGQDMTTEMSPLVRQIFILILMNSVDKGKGISSRQLNETFWPGSDHNSASNNRGVNIRKLRLLLDKIGDISLLHSNEYWHIHFGQGVKCDYAEALSLLREIGRAKASPNRQTLTKLLAIVSKGVLLPDFNYEWMDRYTAEYSNRLIDVLLKVAGDPDNKLDDELMLLVARTILLHDSTDEEAIGIKCRILHRKGQTWQSKQAFDKFCKEYARLLDTMPDISYDDLIKPEYPNMP